MASNPAALALVITTTWRMVEPCRKTALVDEPTDTFITGLHKEVSMILHKRPIVGPGDCHTGNSSAYKPSNNHEKTFSPPAAKIDLRPIAEDRPAQ